MSQVDFASTVGNLVLEKPSRSRIFQQYRIDFCCGGRRSLSEACEKAGVDAQEVLAALQQLDEASAPAEIDAAHMTLAALTDHIEATHHEFLRREFPRLTLLVDKVARVHGENHPELLDVRRVYHALRGELEMHLRKEEQVLFPLMRSLEAGVKGAENHCGGIRNPIRVMEHEHDDAGEMLRFLRKLTRDYTPPADACGSYRAMMDGLRELEEDLHIHIHKENNLLHPKAMAVADGRCGG